MVHRLRPLSASVRRTLYASLIATLALAAPMAAAEKDSSVAPATPQQCALLDDPRTAGRLDGLLVYLAKACGREAEFLGGVRQESAFPGENFAPEATDVLINDTAADGTTDAYTQSETTVAANETTGTLCSAWNDSHSGVTLGLGYSGFGRSTNGGASFTDQGNFPTVNFGDPSLVWRKSDGKFYYAALSSSGGLVLYRSDDDCVSFVQVGAISSTGNDDKEIMTVDNTPASPYYGRLYVAWTDFTDGRINLRKSSNGGTSWDAALDLSAASADVQGAWPAVAPNGDVYVAWVRWNPYSTGPIDIEVVKSTDGGATFAAVANPMTGKVNPRDTAATSSCSRPALKGNIRYLPSPQIAVDSVGNVHVVYTYDPDATGSGDVVNVYYRRSTTGGASWDAEIQVNDDATTTDQWFPSLSIGVGNVVTIGYYSRQLDTAGNTLFDYYSRTSFNGGASFNASVRVSDASSAVTLDGELATCYHGDYDTQVHAGGFAHYVWSDDRNPGSGANPNVWTDVTPAGTDFLPIPQQASQSICAPNNGVYTIDVLKFQTFAESVTLSATGNPAGTTVGFSPNGQVPPFSSTLTVGNTGAASAGSSTITVTGTSSPGGIVHSTPVGLTIYTAAPGASTLTSPADGATQVVTKPTFVWAATANATGYTLELDNDASFATPFYTAAVNGTSHTLPIALPRAAQVFWRVTALNPCGPGTASGVYDLTVSDALCWQPNLAIPDDPDVSDTRSIVGFSGAITDLDLVLRATHTWVGDMIFRLVHVDTGTTVIVIDRPGSCSGDNFDVLLNDEGTDGTVESACNASPPAVSGNRTPNNPLSAFDTQSLAGSWRLECSDQAGQDTGGLQEWCLQATGVVDSLLFADDFEFGSAGRWSVIGF